MHIAFTLADLRVGGAEINAVNLARLLMERGHRVTVVAGGGPLEGELRTHGVPHLTQPMRLKRPWTMPGTAQALLRLHRTDPIDVVHAFMASGAVAATLARAGRRHPPFAVVAAPPGFSQGRHEPAALSRLRLRLLATGVDLVLAPSTAFMRESLRVGIPADRLRLVPFNATLLDRFGPAVRSPALRAELDLGPDDLIVCSLARLHPTKGQDLVLRSGPAVLRAVPAARFVFVGDGEWRDHLAGLARELGIDHAVRFAGQRSDIPEILAESTVLVQTTFGFGGPGLSVIEAFAAGVPVVGMSFPDLEEAVAASGGAITLPHGDIDGLAGAIVRVLADRELAQAMGSRAKAHAAAHFDMRGIAAVLEDIYREVRPAAGDRDRR